MPLDRACDIFTAVTVTVTVTVIVAMIVTVLLELLTCKQRDPEHHCHGHIMLAGMLRHVLYEIHI
jgi:hypothetical protein